MESHKLADKSRRKLAAAQSWMELGVQRHVQHNHNHEYVAGICEHACCRIFSSIGVHFDISESGHELVSRYIP